MGSEATACERRDELALRLLARADDHRVHGQEPRLTTLRDSEPGIVDPLVGHAGDHAHAAALEREAMHPARRLAEVAAGRRRPSLQQPDLARREGLRRWHEAPTG